MRLFKIAAITFVACVIIVVFVGSCVMGQTPVYNSIPTHENFLGGNPNSIELVDFDRDGNLDILATEPANHLVGVRFVNNNVYYSQLFWTANTPRKAALRDLNNDEQPDMIVLTDNEVLVYTDQAVSYAYPIFVAPTSSAWQPSLAGREMVVKDTDNDGIPEVFVLLHNTYTSATTSFIHKMVPALNPWGNVYLSTVNSITTASPTPVGLQVEDFNGDGNYDIAWANPSVAPSGWSNFQVALYTGTGGNGFTTTTSPLLSPAVVTMASADIDNDSDRDIVLAQGGTSGLFEFKNNGTGAFSFWYGIGIVPSPLDLKIADVNDDGVVDYVVGLNGFVTIFYRSTNSLVTSQTIADAGNHSAIAIGDVHGADDDLDIVSANSVGTNEFTAFENQLAALGFAGNGIQLLRINGSLGGATGVSHVVTVAQNQPIALSVDNTPQDPMMPYNANWVLFAWIGNPGAAGATQTFAGWMAFQPGFCLVPSLSFVVASSVSGFCPIVQGTTAPWATAFSGLAYPATITIQAIIEKSAPSQMGINPTITNAVVLQVL